jgi:hypothetical protein
MYLTSETSNRYNSAIAAVTKNFQINVFLEKRRFRRFISKNVRETARFFAIFGYFVWL